MSSQLVIIGAGGHGRVIADIAILNGYDDIVFLDDSPSVSTAGPVKEFSKHLSADFIVAIGSNSIRKNIQKQLENAHAKVVSLIHPQAVVASDVIIGNGSVVMAGSVINPGVIIGNGVIINTCSSVDHDCIIADYVHISVGSHIAGSVSIGDETVVGAGATVINNISICKNCLIGAGAVVVKDIPFPDTYVGIPAKRLSKK